MAASEVVGRVLLAGDQLLRVEQLAVRAGADLIDDRRLQIDEHAAGHVLASASLREEGVERVIAAADRLVGRHLAIRLNAVLQAEQLPAGVTDLDTWEWNFRVPIALTGPRWSTLAGRVTHFFLVNVLRLAQRNPCCRKKTVQQSSIS